MYNPLYTAAAINRGFGHFAHVNSGFAERMWRNTTSYFDIFGWRVFSQVHDALQKSGTGRGTNFASLKKKQTNCLLKSVSSKLGKTDRWTRD